MGKERRINVNKRDVMKWTDNMDNDFIDALLHQQSLGNRIDKVFTTRAYENMVKELHEKFGMPIGKGHLKNRLKTLKHNFFDCYDFFKGRSGFAWSPETKMFTANLETWKALEKVEPEARKWMVTKIPNYDKLFTLFAKERERCDIVPGRWASSVSAGKFDGVSLEDAFNICVEDIDMNDGTSQVDSQAPSQSATSLKGKKRKLQKVDSFEKEFKSIREAIKDVANAIREGNVIAERGRPRVYSEEEVFTELVNIGVETHLRYKAYTFLIANAGRVRAFFGCPVLERKEFLLQMMYSPDVCAS